MNFIKIEGWSAARALGVTPDGHGLLIQVQGIFCRNCGTCKSRVEHVKARAIELGIEVVWRDDEACAIVPRPDVDESDSLAREKWLSHFFDSPVRFFRLVPE
jgi:hypothetical protein